MEQRIMNWRLSMLMAIALVSGLSIRASAQQQPTTSSGGAQPASGGYFTAGGASTTLLGDCSDCEGDNYLHGGSFMAGAGMALNSRADLGGEFLYVPVTLTTGDQLRVSYLMVSVQVRPWQSKGFFLKAGSGMAFLKNFLKTVNDEGTPLRSKAFALGIGTGWEWRTRSRVGVQAFATLHAAALGDLQTSERTIQNVMGNFWSVGGAIMFR
jgi:hypothetical protein